MSTLFDVRAARSSARYKRLRLNFRRAHPLCAECKRRGIIKAADEIDHIIPVEKAPELFWDQTNWQALCRRPCHEAKTANENRREETLAERAWRERIERVYGG